LITASSDFRAFQYSSRPVLSPSGPSSSQMSFRSSFPRKNRASSFSRLAASRARERPAVADVGHEGGDERRTRRAQPERFLLVRFLPVDLLVGRLLEQAFELEEQR
jgi:hypothetical protein